MAEDQAASRVAFFGFQLINTSLESTTPKETMRIFHCGGRRSPRNLKIEAKLYAFIVLRFIAPYPAPAYGLGFAEPERGSTCRREPSPLCGH
jgi:hypothetical protein